MLPVNKVRGRRGKYPCLINMQKKGILEIALMMIMMLTFMGIANADTTKATIIFEEGGLNWGDLDSTGLEDMDFEFGTHFLPSGMVTYDTTNAPHMIYVEDARSTHGGWNVKVQMTEFSAASHTDFEGVITLSGGAADDPNVTVLTPIEIASQASDENVMSATAAAGRGVFEGKWEDESQVQLTVSATEAFLHRDVDIRRPSNRTIHTARISRNG